MRVPKLFVLALFVAAVIAALASTPAVKSQSATEAPSGFDNLTNNFEPQGDANTPGTFLGDKAVFEKRDTIETGLGPVYNAQSCAECHQNPVTGAISQIFELRAGHSAPDGTFVDAPGGSLIQARATNAQIQERVPDSSRIVFTVNGGKIYVMGNDGGQYGQVANDPDNSSVPSFSPDGRQILFSHYVSGINQIFVMNVDGTNQTQLTNDPSSASNAAWSPDGSTILFASNRSGTRQIWAMNPDGSNLRNLTNDSIGGNDAPAWSPDSTQIAFQRFRDGYTDIWVMNADGSNQHDVTNHASFNASPSWSPDGTAIAFYTNRHGNDEIYKTDLTGAVQTRLTTNAAMDQSPAWSPDGSLIAFHSSRGGGAFNVCVMNADGSNPVQLFKRSMSSSTNPHWSPDTGENVRTFRASLNILGDGFVEATDDATLLAIRDSQPVEMRGTAISVPVLEANGQTRIGRFGWKNSIASLLSFSAVAYKGEVGVTSPLQPTESSSLGRSVAAFDPLADPEDDATPEHPFGEDVEAFTRFMRSTKAPPRDRLLVATDTTEPGSLLFDQLNCAVCHTRTITTAPTGTSFNGGTFVVPAALGNKIFHPFGDFLLHDIGTGDGIVETNGEVTRNLVRTAPLWGVRTRDRLMHDGGSSSPPSNNGAQSFTLAEAILRHAGQATASRNAFQALTPAQKAQLLKFLKSL